MLNSEHKPKTLVIPGAYGNNTSGIKVEQWGTHPSWKRMGDGNTFMRMRAVHAERTFLELSIEEVAFPDKPGGKHVTKSTYMTLHEEAALAVYEYLKSVFEKKEVV